MRQLPPIDEVVDAAAKHASQGAIPENVIPFSPPEAGSVPGGVNIGVVSRGGESFVRVVWMTAGSLSVIDLPTKADDGANLAEIVGNTILKCARQGRSGLVTVS